MKRNNLILSVCALFAVTFVLQSCVVPIHSGDKSTEEKTEAATKPEPKEPNYQYKTHPDENVLCTNLATDYLLLVNKTHPLGESYVPATLTELSKISLVKTEYLESRTRDALYAMLDELAADGITVTVTSAYRSYQRQSELYNEYYLTESTSITENAYRHFGTAYIYDHYTSKGKSALSPKDAAEVASSYSALPGQSEHQSGLCVDFITPDMDGNLNVDFENKAVFRWLSENAYKFGFILRYPKEKENVTGYSYEPWHYRFVGREAATEIWKYGLTLEEYLEKGMK